jgi:hypothetical protein
VLTYNIWRNPSLKLKHGDGFPSEVVQDIDLVMHLLRGSRSAYVLTYLVIPAAYSQISASGVPSNASDPESRVLGWAEGTLQCAR